MAHKWNSLEWMEKPHETKTSPVSSPNCNKTAAKLYKICAKCIGKDNKCAQQDSGRRSFLVHRSHFRRLRLALQLANYHRVKFAHTIPTGPKFNLFPCCTSFVSFFFVHFSCCMALSWKKLFESKWTVLCLILSPVHSHSAYVCLTLKH